MLRLLSIRNFAVIESLDAEFESGFTTLTGETGAGKSILLDALSLLLGDRFEVRQLRPGSERAEISAEFDLRDALAAQAMLSEQAFEGGDSLLLRRVLDAQGRSRAWINGSPATLAQLEAVGECLIDVHGQHAHQSLGRPETQRSLLDAFGGFSSLANEVATAWRTWRDAREALAAATRDDQSRRAERERLAETLEAIDRLKPQADEWSTLSATQSRLGHAATLLETAAAGEALLADGEEAVGARLASMAQRLRQAAAHDAALEPVAVMVDEARIGVDEAARTLRQYRERLDLDPAELARVESRLAAMHELARRLRVAPDSLPQLREQTVAALTALDAGGDVARLGVAASKAEGDYRALAKALSAKRNFAAAELGHRVTAMLGDLAMAGGRLEVKLDALAEPSSHGMEDVELMTATHPKQALGPLSRVASGGELSRLGLALQVVLSEVGTVPTLVFDEVDAGIGGGVAAAVGALMRELGRRRQILCVTHLPQVAACADHHARVAKRTRAKSVSTTLEPLQGSERVEEIARMLGGQEITAKTRANAEELIAQGARGAKSPRRGLGK
jgi:DNA repair protein RecN (Recombination protein N)